jgi:hypothetical protein
MNNNTPVEKDSLSASNQASDASSQSAPPRAVAPNNAPSLDTPPTQLDGFTQFVFGVVKGLAAVGCLVPIGFVIVLSAAFSRTSHASPSGLFFFGLVVAVSFIIFVSHGRKYQMSGGLAVVAATAIFLLFITK